LFATARRRNSRGRTDRNSEAAPDADADVATLKDEYRDAVYEFQASEGEIIRAYWCAAEASAVALTEKKKRRWTRRRSSTVGSLELHRVTDWVTADAPAIAELLHSSDTLAIRINRVLTAVPRRIAMEWIFREQSYLLGFVERMGGRPTGRDLRATVARHRRELDRLERYYDRAANKAARIRYFGGMLVGLACVAVLAVVIPSVVELFGNFDFGSETTRKFYACFGAGAVGAIVSVMTRMRQEDGVTLDYEVGGALILMLGAFRPVLGAIFGVLAYFAIDSDFIPITPPPSGTDFFYYALFAFAAGFSERFTHVILGGADLTMARAQTAEEKDEPVQADARVAVAQVTSNGSPKRLATRADATAPAGDDGR
jgi:hypothetical protein